MGLRQRLITEFYPTPHSISGISAFEAPNGSPNRANGKEAMVELRQRFITEFVDSSVVVRMPRGQITLTGDVLPTKATLEGNGKHVDKNARLFHFFKDPTPVLTITKARIIRSDGAHIKVALPKDLREKIGRNGNIEVHHFAGIKEEHPYSIEEGYLRIGTGRFYTQFYDSGETALVKSSGDKLFIITKVGEHPADHMQFKLIGYKSSTGSMPLVKTNRGFIVPLSFYEQARRLFPSVVEVVGKPKRIKIPKRMKEKQKRYVSAPD